MQSFEQPKNFGVILGLDADAIVLHGQAHAFVVARRTNLYLRGAAAGHKFQRVGDQISQHLSHRSRVAVYPAQRFLHFNDGGFIARIFLQ